MNEMTVPHILLHADTVAVVTLADGTYALPRKAHGAQGEWYAAAGVNICRLTTPTDDAALRFVKLRGEARALLTATDYALAVRGAELSWWNSETRFCPRCGTPLVTEGICKRCPRCGKENFPSPAPAILVLVTQGEQALLAHARNFKGPFYGLVAGFVETGESLEQCVAREVKEETSLLIDDIRYFGSQPWPWPFNLMVGFTAHYAGGEIAYADHELSHAAFFDRDSHPQLPPPGSLARDMIDAWIEKTI